MGKRKTFVVDRDRVQRALDVRGLSREEASEKIFLSRKYFYQLTHTENPVISTSTKAKMEEILDIRYDEIKPIEEEPTIYQTQQPAQGSPATFSYPTLERYVHKAVAEAIENRLPKILEDIFTGYNNEFQKVLGRAVYVGTKKALHEVWNNDEEEQK